MVQITIIVQKVLRHRLVCTDPHLLEGSASEHGKTDARLVHRANESLHAFGLLQVVKVVAMGIEQSFI